MRRTLIPATLLILAATGATGAELALGEGALLFDQANAFYLSAEKLSGEGNQEAAAERYNAARTAYEQLEEAGHARASVLYNLGNTYARLGRWGEAIWAYRRALWLTPRDADLIANLSYVRGKSRDAIPGRDLSFVRSVLAWHFGLSFGETKLLAITSYFLFCISLSVWCFLRSHLLRRVMYVLAVLLVAFAASGVVKFVDERLPREAVIVAESVDVLSGPSDAGQPRFRLHSGAEVGLEEFANGWVRINLDKERRGWVRRSDCRVL